ncbi:hypothetical protein GcM3_008045 [Golovinomyces cichoracearum]|uniref:Uncharacterized protein n=1 Tax=Golovinomyces cichoracearum TaxID=62708 RepID=A0A420JAH9_9PEZI|nr:hypothetical protein GcM3_008045 [Golovinomyces cichoracearum]
MPAFNTKKTKPLDVKRESSQDKEITVYWLDQYRYSLDIHNNLSENTRNFDEIGCRVGVRRGETVFVPKGATAPHITAPENRKQVTIMEGIDGVGRNIQPCITLEREYHMESWSNELTQTGEELFLLSNPGETNDQLGLR